MYPNERLDTFSGDALTDIFALSSMGQLPGIETVYIFGRNRNIPMGIIGMLWGLDTTLPNTGIVQANPVTCYVSSSSASDVGITLKITVIDASWERQFIGVTLNGQATVALPIQVRRVLSIENMGSSPFVGNIYAGTSATPTLGVQATSSTMQYASADDQISHTAFYTVPLGKTLLIQELSGGTPTNDSVVIAGYYSNPATNVFKVGAYLPAYRTQRSQTIPYFPLPEKTDVYLSAKAYTNNSEAYGTLIGILVDSDYVIQ